MATDPKISWCLKFQVISFLFYPGPILHMETLLSMFMRSPWGGFCPRVKQKCCNLNFLTPASPISARAFFLSKFANKSTPMRKYLPNF